MCPGVEVRLPNAPWILPGVGDDPLQLYGVGQGFLPCALRPIFRHIEVLQHRRYTAPGLRAGSLYCVHLYFAAIPPQWLGLCEHAEVGADDRLYPFVPLLGGDQNGFEDVKGKGRE